MSIDTERADLERQWRMTGSDEDKEHYRRCLERAGEATRAFVVVEFNWQYNDEFYDADYEDEGARTQYQAYANREDAERVFQDKTLERVTEIERDASGVTDALDYTGVSWGRTGDEGDHWLSVKGWEDVSDELKEELGFPISKREMLDLVWDEGSGRTHALSLLDKPAELVLQLLAALNIKFFEIGELDLLDPTQAEKLEGKLA